MILPSNSKSSRIPITSSHIWTITSKYRTAEL